MYHIYLLATEKIYNAYKYLAVFNMQKGLYLIQMSVFECLTAYT